MDELTKILLSAILIALFVQLGLTAALNWDEKTKNNKKLDAAVNIHSAITLSTIIISVLILLLRLIWNG